MDFFEMHNKYRNIKIEKEAKKEFWNGLGFIGLSIIGIVLTFIIFGL